MADMQWTPQQRAAIESRGGTLLVSAAAGSGKTAVLSQRVVGLITDPINPVDVDRLLVVTFSNAAASEMRQRISRRLWELGREDPANSLYERQQILLESAQISTVHAFCISLLWRFFHRLGLPAQFRVVEEYELSVMKAEVLERVLQKEYAAMDPAFLNLAELLSGARNDLKLEQTLLRLFGFVRNHPFYEEWTGKALGQYDPEIPLTKTPWGAILMEYAGQAVDYCLALNASAREMMALDDQLSAGYLQAFLEDERTLETCRDALKSGDWDTCFAVFGAASFGRIGAVSKNYPHPEKKEQVKALRDEVKDIFVKELKTRCFLMPETLYRKDVEQQRPLLEKLFAILLDFDRALKEVKLERGLLDFGDLEHYTLSLLYEKADGRLLPSDIAKELSGQYAEILIDEYQDTNEIQERIFAAISRDGSNLFMVGDVKQSIYRFRHARPELFLRKKAEYDMYDGERFPAKISLGTNFRTRKETIEVINFLFRGIMNPTVGEMVYSGEDALIAGGGYDESRELPVTLSVIDGQGEPGRERQARYVAEEIRELLQSGVQVETKEGTRPLCPGDICILIRSPKNKIDTYTKELDRLGIAHWEENTGGFLESQEVAPVVAFLKILTNPLLDMELAQVLLSPLYGHSAQDLAFAFAKGKKGTPLFLTLRQLSEGGDRLFDAFLTDCAFLRNLSVEAPPEEVLFHLYARTEMLSKASAMPRGENRAANLRLLLEYAGKQEAAGKDFADFVGFLYSLEGYGADLDGASAAGGNGVCVMSVHKSKGLEFPVVFLVEAGSRFNLREFSDDVQLHPDLGVAFVLRDNRMLCQHETLPRAAMSLENRRASLSEEMRILYVAMTRARERLYIVGMDKDHKKMERALQVPFQGSGMSPWAVRGATCFLDWILPVLCRHPDLDPPMMGGESGERTEEGRLRLVTPECSLEEGGTAPEGENIPEPDEAAIAELEKRLAFEYPFEADVKTLSKYTVSELTSAGSEEVFLFARRPKALTRKQMTPAERGVAAHKFMQFADFSLAREDLEEEIARLRHHGFITGEEAEVIDREVLKHFFEGPVGERILAADAVHREIRFLQEFTPEELQSVDPTLEMGANTVVQGIADCVIVEGGRGVIIDYKTDEVKDGKELAKRYRTQLLLYKKILERFLEVPIAETLIYSFTLSEIIRVE